MQFFDEFPANIAIHRASHWDILRYMSIEISCNARLQGSDIFVFREYNDCDPAAGLSGAADADKEARH